MLSTTAFSVFLPCTTHANVFRISYKLNPYVNLEDTLATLNPQFLFSEFYMFMYDHIPIEFKNARNNSRY